MKSNKSKQEEKKFPKFISTTPKGIDRFEGGSANRVAIAIEKHIKNIEELEKFEDEKFRRIIGLEGKWGSGKSNIISILKDNIEKSHYLFEYDSWGHQEDLQRRSFLETLTYDLIKAENGKLLRQKCSRKNENEEEEGWSDKLKNLLARKRETIIRNKPKLSKGVTGILIVFILSPIMTVIGDNDDFPIWLRLLIGLFPLLIILIVWIVYCRFFKKKWVWAELFEIYTGDKLIDVVNETISEKEPSAKEFKDWMKDLSEDLKKPVIIVFDNMDRLPAEKVKQLWSSIHTFFAEEHYEKIWVIIPYDKSHLANAFENVEKNNNKALLGHFLSKTFPINYRVSPPIMTDWKKLFSELFDEAFGKIDEDEKYTVLRIFKIFKKDFTPRDIITFINEMVALKKTWDGEDMPLISIALFTLNKDEILDAPVNEILSGSYLEPVTKLISNNEELQSHISALVYGLTINAARQIPLKKYIASSLTGDSSNDINKYIEHSHFKQVLDEEIDDLDITKVDDAILSLAKIDNADIDVTRQWNKLAKLSMKNNIEFTFGDINQYLLLYTSKTIKLKYAQFLCDSYREHEQFKGSDYFDILSELEKFGETNNLEINISKYIQDKTVEPEDFIGYLEHSKNERAKFKLICDNKELNQFLIGKITDSQFDFNFLEYILDDNLYSFKDLEDSIENELGTDKIPLTNLSNVIIAYKLISDEKPLKKQLTTAKMQQLLNSIKDKTSEAYYDAVAMNLANKISNLAYESELEIKLAERLEFFKSYGDLLIVCKDWGNELLRKSVRYMTENSLGTDLDLIKIMPHFETIKTALDIDEGVFINELSNWNQEENITIENLITQVSNTLVYKYSTENPNKLTSHIITVAQKKLATISVEDLYNERKISGYWLNCASHLITGNLLKRLPDNLIEFSKKILVDIGNGTQAIPEPGHEIEVIITKADKRELQGTIKDIGIDFCNKVKNITPDLFLFFEKNYNLTSKIKNRDGDVASVILNSVISSALVMRYISENPDIYLEIIKNAGDDAIDLKKKIKEVYIKEDSPKEMKIFAIKIGIELE